MRFPHPHPDLDVKPSLISDQRSSVAKLCHMMVETILLKHPVPPLAAVIKMHYSQVAPEDTLPLHEPGLKRLLLTWPLNLDAHDLIWSAGSGVATNQSNIES